MKRSADELLKSLNNVRVFRGRIPYVELFADGSGRLMVGGQEWAEFQNIEEGIAKISKVIPPQRASTNLRTSL